MKGKPITPLKSEWKVVRSVLIIFYGFFSGIFVQFFIEMDNCKRLKKLFVWIFQSLNSVKIDIVTVDQPFVIGFLFTFGTWYIGVQREKSFFALYNSIKWQPSFVTGGIWYIHNQCPPRDFSAWIAKQTIKFRLEFEIKMQLRTAIRTISIRESKGGRKVKFYGMC